MITPTSIEQKREKEAQLRSRLKGRLNLSSFDIRKLSESIPNNLKTQGQARLSALILSQSGKFLTKALPGLTELLAKFGITNIETILEDFDAEAFKEEFCPTTDELNNIIEQRNNLVEYVNSIGNTLDALTVTIDFGAGFAKFIQGLVTRLSQTKLGATISMALIPFALPGAVPAGVSTLGDVTDKLLFNTDGTPRLPPITITASNVSPAVASTQATILQTVELLGALDILIKKCNPNSTLIDTSKTIQDTAANELIANDSTNGSTYKGFILEIETKEFTDTVDQNRAVGKNNSGIVLIATEYSFASNPQVLINELKFIIDRDDLKAY